MQRFLALLLLLLGYSAAAKAAVFYPTTYTLDNGLQIVIVTNHLAPVVTQMVWYKVGSADEVPGKTGLAHYLEHLMFRGTKKLGPGEFHKRIAAQGGTNNAFTSYDYTVYHETVAADRLSMIMEMEADRMQNLIITPEIAKPELSVVLDERQQRTGNSPQGRFNEKVRATLMPQYPYGSPVIGWQTEVEKLTAEDAREFYKRYYTPNNAVVIISGDVKPEEVIKLAQSIYGPIPRRNIPERPKLPLLPMPSDRRLIMADARVEQPQFQFHAVMPSYATQKNNQAYALEVLNAALGSGEVGLLYRKLVVEQGLASGIWVDYDPDARYTALFTISVTPRPGRTPEDVEKALHGELKKLAKSGLEKNEVEKAKTRLQRAALFARDSLELPGYNFGMTLTTGHTVEDVEAWPERIKAVTVEQVNIALRDVVATPRSLAAMLLPDPKTMQTSPTPVVPVIDQDKEVR